MNEKNTEKVWITKYALTKGVYEETVEVRSTIPGMAVCVENRLQTFHGAEWHRDKVSAINKASDMRKAKVKSLQKQIDKLNRLTFWL